MGVKVDTDLCDGCKDCEASCPTDAIKVKEETGKSECEVDLCIDCNACIDACPKQAIAPTE